MAKKHQGVKKGKKVQNMVNWIQPAFDPRIYTMPFGLSSSELGSTLHRGKIQQAVRITGMKDWNSVNFLYNPSQVAASYALASTDQVAAQLYPQQGDTSTIRLPLNQSVSFSLLFDRTYELWDESKKSTPAGTYGVMVDVWAMQQLVGMNADPAKVTKTGASNSTSLGSSGLMMTTFCWFYFGGRESLTYFGSIQAFDVTYTHWTQLMVPMRCAMNVTVQLYPEDIAKDLVAGNAAKKKKQTADQAPPWSSIPATPGHPKKRNTGQPSNTTLGR